MALTVDSTEDEANPMELARLSDERCFDRSEERANPEYWADRSRFGMLAAAHYRATAAGLEILEAGGNAVDAALAASLALVVCEPAASGLGGMALMLIHEARSGKTVALEGPCRAPARATPERANRGSRRTGYNAIAVPTYVATIARAAERHGTIPLGELLEPAIRLARDGFPLTALQCQLLSTFARSLARHRGGAYFLHPTARPPPTGFWLRQAELASTLDRLRDAGWEDFYRGEIGRCIVTDMEAHDALLGAEDFRDPPRPHEAAALCGSFRGATVLTMGPPAGGATLLHMLHLSDELSRSPAPALRPAVVLATIIREARRARIRHRLDSAAWLEAIRGEGLRRTLPVLRAELSGGETTHISAMDRHGNAVAMTQSIERCFGSKVVTPGLGFLYNGYMRTFKLQSPEHPHFLRPGALARSNAAPTIVLEDGRPTVALGSTGSERMVSGMFGVLERLFERGKTLEAAFEAVLAPRLHATPDGEVLLEEERFPAADLEALDARGFRRVALDAYSFQVGGLHLVTREDGAWIGVAEPRRDGAAAGPGRAPPGRESETDRLP